MEVAKSRSWLITGGCGALHDGTSPDGSPAQQTITHIHQAYGQEYQLPNTTAHNETCANIANAMWNWRILLLTGEARFADVMELVFYNSALAGISLDGKKFFYTNTLRQEAELPFELRWSRTREPHIPYSFCCPPNIVRVIAEAGSYAYGLSDDRLWAHLYGSNVLSTTLPNGTSLKLTQKTDYPWDGHVTITIDEVDSSEFAIMLRIPGWTPTAWCRTTACPPGAPSLDRGGCTRPAWRYCPTADCSPRRSTCWPPRCPPRFLPGP